MIEILFGKHLDGSRGVGLPDSLGKATFGPEGMLNFLETHLGLLTIHSSQTERIIQYRDILNQFKEGAFYQASFELDELGTSSTLLQWRDEWYLNGWEGEIIGQSAERLTALANIEKQAASKVSMNAGQRLQKICLALGQSLKVPIKHLKLLENLNKYPKAWQNVFKVLNPEYQSIVPCSSNSLLADIQSRFASGKLDGSTIPWRDDGSVRILQSDLSVLAANALATEMKSQAVECLLVADRHTSLLDEVLQSHGLPIQGLDELSTFRPALQVLPLALQQLWSPVDVHALLEFLTHPICPVPSSVRRKIAKLVASKPGIDDKAWLQLIDENASEETKSKERAQNALIIYLLGERYEPQQGAAIERILRLSDDLTQYFKNRLASESSMEIMAFKAGYQQCVAFAKAVGALRDQGVLFLKRRQLELLEEQATAVGVAHGLGRTEVGAVAYSRHPAEVSGDYEHVIWWQPTMPSLPSNYVWSHSELKVLQTSGVELPRLTDQLTWMMSDWIRPLLAARDKLTLVLPSSEEEAHPILLMIKALCPDMPEQTLDAAVLQGDWLGTMPILASPLPPIQSKWQLPANSFSTTREKDSYSSLNIQLNNPSQWLLRYVANIKQSNLLAIPDDFTLMGSLAHRMIELLFKEHALNALTWREEELQKWFEPTFQALIQREGAVFLMLGKHNEAAVFRGQLYTAIHRLLGILDRAKTQTVESEYALNGMFNGGNLGGSADLVLTLPIYGAVIVDMKWGGKKYETRLKNNQHLQLVMYGELYRQMGHSLAKPAYYILSSNRMIYIDHGLFPQEKPLEQNEDAPTAATLWQSFHVTWRWRQEQLKKGSIHIAIEANTESLEACPEDGFPLDEPSDRYNPYLSLCGWRNDQ